MRVADSFNNSSEVIVFYNEILSNSRSKLGLAAATLLDIDIALATLKLGQSEESKKVLEHLQESLVKINSTETVVYSKYYHACSELRKIIGPPQEYYKTALQFLAYTPLETLKTDFKYELATDIALAAATSDGIYNFGEILTNPLLDVLKGTPNEWLRDLMLSLHHGNITEFNRIVGSYREQYFGQIALANRHEEVKKKIVLLCLVTMVFERHPHDRTLSFVDISLRTQVPLSQVEWVLMSALSLELIRGNIDEVSQVIEVSWVLPRVLEPDQLQLLAKQVAVWSKK
jgi:26S proteasome regulatory subunit N9